MAAIVWGCLNQVQLLMSSLPLHLHLLPSQPASLVLVSPSVSSLQAGLSSRVHLRWQPRVLLHLQLQQSFHAQQQPTPLLRRSQLLTASALGCG